MINDNEKTEMNEDEKLAFDQAEPATAEPTPAEAEIAELKDRLLRTLADMENLRQRTRREVEEAQTFAVTRFARDLLEVADNLRRAVESAPKDGASEPVRNLVAGVEMTEQSLLSVLERHKVRKVVPAVGERFDHKLHQAMFELPTAELPPGTIAEVMAPGYVIGNRLLRAAMVGVAKAPPEAAGESRGATVDTTA